MTDKDELAALKARVAELERANKAAQPKPPPEPFKPEPYQRYDPTANMSMPMSTMLEMHRVSGHVMGGVIRDNRGPSGPASMIPDSQQSASSRPSAGDGTGWVNPTPLGPSIHQRYVDAQLDAADARDKAELIQREARLAKLTETKP